MSPLQVGALTTVLLGAAWWSAINGLRRAPWSVAAAKRQMRAGEPRALHRITGSAGDGASRWLEAHHGDDLAVTGLTAPEVVSRVLTSATVMAAVVGAGVLASIASGMLPAFALLVPPVAGLLAGWTALRGVATRAATRRRDLRRAANDFVQLVAIGLTTDQSVEAAIHFALDVGAGDGFVELRREVDAAPLRGISVWEAIDDVGRRFGVRELCELAASVERQGLQGVAIGDTVATIAAGMRAKALDELERDAEKANANLSGPTIGFVVATIVFLAYPLAQRISDAFGG